MEKLFLLDAYALIFRAYYALIRTPRVNSKGFNTSAIFGFVNTLEEILHKHQPTHIGIAFDPSGPTFRHEAFQEYKAQRESTPEDIKKSVPIIKDIIEAYHIPILEVKGFEADDVIGTLSWQAGQKGIETYMVTPDKDYGQLVSPTTLQLKPGTGGFSLLGEAEIKEKYSIRETSQVIDILGLMGDTADNIPGCPGVGEKTATQLIQQFNSIEGIYEHIEECKGKLKEKLLANREKVEFSKFLATIRKDVPIELDMERLAKKEINKEALRGIFEELEFRSLIKKICGEPTEQANSPTPTKSSPSKEANPKQGPIQLDLFGDNPIDEPKEILHENFKEESLAGAKYEIIDTESKVEELREKLLTNDLAAFSLATTTLNGIDAEITSMAWSTRSGEAFFLSCEGGDRSPACVMEKIRDIFESEKIMKVGHNLKFSQLALSHYGIQLKGPLFDTMLAHYIIQPELKHDLDYVSQIYLHHEGMSLEPYFGSKWREERNMRLMPEEELVNFVCEQTDMTIRLYPRLKSEIRHYGMEALFHEVEMPLACVLAKMETNGVVINRESLRETSKIFTERMQEYEQEVFRISQHPFNLSSPKQVGDVLFGEMKLLAKPKKTKSGQYVTSEAVLEEIRHTAPIVDNLLKYRGMKKLLTTYVDALPTLVNPRTGHIHTNFNQAVTATGRLSSSNPNLQNIPVRGDDGKEIRRAFIPEPGSLFLSADYSQIELRIMAHLSGDIHMIEAFRHGYDIHAATAAKIYHKHIEEISGDERRKAKTANFGIIYGITVFGLAQRIGISRSEAKELIENYFITFPGVQQFMQNSIEKARSRGYIETLFHRRRYLPDIQSGNAVVRGYAERNAINAPIQASAADIIKVAMVRIANRFEKEGIQSKMILQVHDELNFSVIPEEKEQVELIVKHEMEQACQLEVPLIAEIGWGKNWLEAH